MKFNSLRISITVLVVLIGGFAWTGESASDLRITALGNEGFLIETGRSTIVVDGLYRGLEGYIAPTGEQRGRRERAEPPFDDVDLVLATHHHPDHFDAEIVARHLTANPRGVLITTPTAFDPVEPMSRPRTHGSSPRRGCRETVGRR